MKYDILYIDPPWYFPPRKNSGTKFGGGITDKYPVMKIDEIRDLPIGELADENCALFFWATTSRTTDSDIVDKLDLMRHWGFRIVNIGFNWKKQYKNGKTQFGTGYYTKGGSEICWLGIKGKMKPISNYVSSIVEREIMRHSKKPPEIRDKIVEMFGDLPRMEIFAREKVDGWDSIGLGVSGKTIQEEIKEYLD